MENDIHAWWAILHSLIHEGASHRLEDERGPLVHLHNAETNLGLKSFPDVRWQPKGTPPKTLFTEPKFKHLTTDALLHLRAKLYDGEDLNLVNAWAEKLMRYCEIWRHDLQSRALKNWPAEQEARLSMLQLVSFLLDFYYHSDDPRFLNTVLKLSDMKWIANSKDVTAGLRSNDDPTFVAALFQVRTYLLLDNALMDLRRKVAL